ncbi:restriction endonuclease subunit S [Cupriavidus sp. WGtm5]|uniref:restriction endonuclease subunit S n=1 Tax=Cupriavidus sp. WGtm5 TaxID=2919926 RepID=UPI002091159B|nr:restriction endonuclease subunit S [Cupriavidus sp. WGtm5]MCO4890904.1 restriction endonuclease subunit S [Cupriavidus sp. WGtm5]
MKDITSVIPASWAPVTIGEICSNIQYGYTASASEEPCGPRFLRITDIQNGSVHWPSVPYCQIPGESIEKFQLNAGDIVFARTGGTVGKSFIVDCIPEQSVFASYLIRLSALREINPKFLYYFFQSLSYWEQIELKKGGLQGNVNATTLSSLKLFICPPNEQHRIVAKIEELFSELDAGIESLKAAQAQLKVYRQALLKHAFDGKLTAQWREEQFSKGKLSSVHDALKATEPPPRPNRWKSRSKDTILGHSVLAVGNPKTPLPDGWHWVPMVDIARMESGHTPSRSHPEWWGGEIPWISIPDARKNHGSVITHTAQTTNPLGLENSAARLLPAKTVCVSRTASVGYVVELGKPMATSQDFVNWVPSDVVRPEWLRLVFGADREALLKFGKGTTHKTIYFPEWLSVHIGLPSIEEQIQIVEEVEAKLSNLNKLNSTIADSLEKTEALRQSILKKAFSGQLVPQDPHDEPASSLLARIKAEKPVNPQGKKARK